jgi:hypothetical protein
MTDEQKAHDDAERKNINNDSDDSDIDEADDTAENTNNDSQDDKDEAEKVAETQEKKWLDKIKSGEKKLDDMPENLGWLKKRVAEKLVPKKEQKPVDEDELSAKIRLTLQAERAEEEFNFLVDGLKESGLDSEKEAELQEEYENLISEFPNPTIVQKLKCLRIACKATGVKDNSETLKERKRKAMTLPPFGGKKRSTGKKEDMTDMEKKLSGNLPPGFTI